MRTTLLSLLMLFTACTKGQTGILGIITTPQTHVGESWAGKKVRYIGDSITEGVGASTTSNRWTSKLSALKGNTEENQGQSGRTLQYLCAETPSYSASLVPDYTTDYQYLFMALGVNDQAYVMGGNDSASYATALNAFIDTAVAKGWAANRIVVVTPYWINQFNSTAGSCGSTGASNYTRLESFVGAAKGVALSRGTILADTYTEMSSQGNPAALLSDGVHPNDTGHQLIADYLNALDYSVYGG